MSTFFIPVPTHDPVVNSARYFSERKALSKDTAIEVSATDWISMGFRWGVKWAQYKFIKEENGKFWLDEQELEAFEDKMKMVPLWFVIATILISAVIITIVFLLS